MRELINASAQVISPSAVDAAQVFLAIYVLLLALKEAL